jgi:hypothetical protein
VGEGFKTRPIFWIHQKDIFPPKGRVAIDPRNACSSRRYKSLAEHLFVRVIPGPQPSVFVVVVGFNETEKRINISLRRPG